jgi:hypothetical protein
LALAEQSAVPVVKNVKVSGLRLGVSVVIGLSNSGTGYSAYGTIAVRTTNTVSRGFERERNVERFRRSELFGCEAATLVRIEEASGGREALSAAGVVAAFFRSCLLLCGGSSDIFGDSSGTAAFAEVLAAEVDEARLLRLETTVSRQFDRSTTLLERKNGAAWP